MKKIINIDNQYTEYEVKVTFTSLYGEVITLTSPIGRGLLYPGAVALRELEDELERLEGRISRPMARALLLNLQLCSQEWLEIKANQLWVCSPEWWEGYPLAEII